MPGIGHLKQMGRICIIWMEFFSLHRKNEALRWSNISGGLFLLHWDYWITEWE